MSTPLDEGQLEEHSVILERFLLGLSGQRLELEAAETIQTDAETLFMPRRPAASRVPSTIFAS